MVDYALRPADLSGCWATWSEQDLPQTIRTSVDTGDVKVRRRVTGVHRRANVSAQFPANQYSDFVTWYRTLCSAGIKPTAMFEPNGTEGVWRFAEPPTISWPSVGGEVFAVSAVIEKLPGWQNL